MQYNKLYSVGSYLLFSLRNSGNYIAYLYTGGRTQAKEQLHPTWTGGLHYPLVHLNHV